jgi:hypothetical protein
VWLSAAGLMEFAEVDSGKLNARVRRSHDRDDLVGRNPMSCAGQQRQTGWELTLSGAGYEPPGASPGAHCLQVFVQSRVQMNERGTRVPFPPGLILGGRLTRCTISVSNFNHDGAPVRAPPVDSFSLEFSTRREPVGSMLRRTCPGPQGVHSSLRLSSDSESTAVEPEGLAAAR